MNTSQSDGLGQLSTHAGGAGDGRTRRLPDLRPRSNTDERDATTGRSRASMSINTRHHATRPRGCRPPILVR